MSNAPCDAPFDLDNEGAFERWREKKLTGYPKNVQELVVEIKDPWHLNPGERQAIVARCAKANMALYVTRAAPTESKPPLPMAIMSQLGVVDLDHNQAAQAGGQSNLTSGGESRDEFSGFVPYRATALGWHTDGCYNHREQQVRSLALHCERPAASGGENVLLDPEILFIRLREQNPELLRPLMDPEVMTLRARSHGGREVRPARPGPVFSIHSSDGRLHTRYTSRKKSLIWKESPALAPAIAALMAVLQSPSPFHFQATLEAGWGLICNNVLHTRGAFQESPDAGKRLLLRARYFDPIPRAFPQGLRD